MTHYVNIFLSSVFVAVELN